LHPTYDVIANEVKQSRAGMNTFMIDEEWELIKWKKQETEREIWDLFP
jgi:hypothetical protein